MCLICNMSHFGVWLRLEQEGLAAGVTRVVALGLEGGHTLGGIALIFSLSLIESLKTS